MVSIATRLRASRTVSQTRPRARHPAPIGAHLPVGDITLAGSGRCQIALICQSKQKRVQRGNVTAKNKGTWAVSAEADDFFELSGGRLPPEDIALRCQSRPICVRRDSVTNKTKGAACSPLGAPHQGDIQGALPLDHFRILFLREKDVPAPA